MIPLIILLHFIAINCYATEKKSKLVTKKISIECDNQGYPKKNTLKALVTAQYLNKFNNNKISIKEIPGGYYTEKMYIVMGKKNGKKTPAFFLKISKKSNSTKNLIKIQEGPIGQKFKKATDPKITRSHNTTSNASTISPKNIPHIIWLEDVFAYQDQEGRTRTIEVTPAAQGMLIKEILDSKDMPMIQKASCALGKNLGTFHQIFMDKNNPDNQDPWKTVCHRDFHIKNTLFNSETNKIYFIDNESMQEGSIAQDIKTILISLLMFRYLQRNHANRWPIYLEYCQKFLKGYIESYPIETQRKLAHFIEKTLDNGLHKVLYEKIIKDRTITGKKFNVKEFKKTIYNYLHTFNK